jgi:hypothetical protein
MNLFSTIVRVPVNGVPGNMKLEIIGVQCTSGLKEKYSNFGLFDFCSTYNDTKTFPAIHSHALKIVGSTYLGEQFF